MPAARTRPHPAGHPGAPGSSPGRSPWLPVEPHSQERSEKLYVVVRSDLSPGQQITQAGHAVSLYPDHDPAGHARWRQVSDSLIILGADDEQHLLDLQARARHADVGFIAWREQDFADEVTAVAFLPGPDTPGLLADLPLAGRTEPPARASRRESSLRRLVGTMKECEQTPGMSVLEHGRAVRETYLALLDFAEGLRDPHVEEGWRLPAWLTERAGELLAAQLPQSVVERYLTLHDCGKPKVRAVDDDGRVHFPDHANASARAYRRTLGSDADPVVEELIARDMLMHTGSAEDVLAIADSPLAATLLLAAVAEVHANAAMFGGVQSPSFKGKVKRIDQRGRSLVRHWDEHGWPTGEVNAARE